MFCDSVWNLDVQRFSWRICGQTETKLAPKSEGNRDDNRNSGNAFYLRISKGKLGFSSSKIRIADTQVFQKHIKKQCPMWMLVLGRFVIDGS